MSGLKIEKIVLNRSYIRKLLKSEETMRECEKAASKTGEVDTEYVGTQRCWVKAVKR